MTAVMVSFPAACLSLLDARSCCRRAQLFAATATVCSSGY